LNELPALEAEVAIPVLSSPARGTKRRFEEIADSEGESEFESEDDYGFDAEIDFDSGMAGTRVTT
jgi:hypothetical protein